MSKLQIIGLCLIVVSNALVVCLSIAEYVKKNPIKAVALAILIMTLVGFSLVILGIGM